MRFGVVVFPGSNCDQDCFYVIRDRLAQPVRYIWHKDKRIADYDCIILPGGFSYGDYLRAGAIARFSPIMKPIIDFAHKGGAVLGICNGFQILLEAGLLPGAMLRNDNIHFICKYVYTRVENDSTIFTNSCKKGQILKIPIAHNEGRYYIDENGYSRLKENKQIVLRYCSRQGVVSDEYNPNGAKGNIAGIVNERGNVLGMMPHPERSPEASLGSDDGIYLFDSIITWLRKVI
ncbi:MAG: phosphoribosylformylglycinamidine synthase subunit PurQ [Candidatus Omnitrophica bacterium]|nr:phosphoribosylformylglycinamidine synthase subunit PurQ [Candidatus Omnitrophota bacterium]